MSIITSPHHLSHHRDVITMSSSQSLSHHHSHLHIHLHITSSNDHTPPHPYIISLCVITSQSLPLIIVTLYSSHQAAHVDLKSESTFVPRDICLEPPTPVPITPVPTTLPTDVPTTLPTGIPTAQPSVGPTPFPTFGMTRNLCRFSVFLLV